MLVLSRKVGEKICIDEQITVTVLGIQGNRVRVGIVAPANCHVQRAEILQRRQDFEISDLAESEFMSHTASS